MRFKITAFCFVLILTLITNSPTAVVITAKCSITYETVNTDTHTSTVKSLFKNVRMKTILDNIKSGTAIFDSNRIGDIYSVSNYCDGDRERNGYTVDARLLMSQIYAGWEWDGRVMTDLGCVSVSIVDDTGPQQLYNPISIYRVTKVMKAPMHNMKQFAMASSIRQDNKSQYPLYLPKVGGKTLHIPGFDWFIHFSKSAE